MPTTCSTNNHLSSQSIPKRKVSLGPRQKRKFDFAAKRRREIRLHANFVGAAETDDFDRWPVALVWHMPRTTKDPVGTVMLAAKSMGHRDLTKYEAMSIIEEAADMKPQKTADELAAWLGITYEVRTLLGLTTIGSTNLVIGQ